MPTATNGHIPLVKAKDITAALDNGDEVARLMKTFYPLVVEKAFGDASLAGVPVAFDLEMEEVQTVLDKLAKQVRSVAETTREDVRRLIGQQAENGWSMPELAARILEMGEINSKSRAVMIARSESARAYSQGSIASFKASGVVSAIEWLTADDDVTCPECAGLNGKRTDLDGEFADGIGFPPAHPMCRCVISPIVES